MRVLIIGNSGSGKSTYARLLSRRHGIPHLDLDALVWEPGQIAVARPMDAVARDLRAYTQTTPAWVIEGCYGDLAELLLPACTELVFLNPGLEACLAHTRSRPWEPQKYAEEADQRRMLPQLLAWVAEYYTRDDAWSYRFHRRLFEAFPGARRELASVPAPQGPAEGT